MLWLSWLCSSRRMRGAEIDAWRQDGSPPRAVSVRVGLDGEIHLHHQEVDAPSTAPDPTDRDRLSEQFSLAGIVDGDASWSAV